MSEGRPPHAALLRAPAGFDARLVAGVLARRSALPAESWLPVVRRAWGIVAEPSAAEDAEALAAALTAAGQPALAAPVSLLEEPPPEVVVTKAELSGDGFDVVAGRGAEVERLTWTHLKVVSAGAVVEGGLKPAAVPGGKGNTRPVSEDRRTPFIDLLFAAPARRLRIIAEGFDYAALGPKMSYSAELNFRTLAAELCARAPAALRGKGARGVLSKAPSGALEYESFDDVQREERWLLALSALEAAL
ncbi:MAG: hypothetical protein Q8T11_03215 [Elusimicrobiota bacterium]|nr:hypothetical protein [Elusimicrobiota bacterium]